MLSKNQLSIIGLFFYSISFSFAQNPIDSTYTVPIPPNYELPFEQLVEAATMAPDIAQPQLNFDTTFAKPIEEIVQDYDYIPNVSDELIIDRLTCLQTDMPLTYHPRVRHFIDYFAVTKRDFTLRILQRKNLYFPLFEKVMEEYGVPEQLKYLSIIESALIPTARSRAGAVGLWQFMPATGRLYKLYQNSYRDERMDPEKATRAAAKYLKYLYEYFGDWELALAAYNCGPGNVRKALRRAGKPYKFSSEDGSGQLDINFNSNFWDIYQYLPRETRSYLPQFVAMIYVLSYAEEHNLIQDKPFYPIPTEDVYVSQSVDLYKLSENIGICFDDLKLINPELRYGYIPSGVKNYALKIPQARFRMFDMNRSKILEASKYTGRSYYYNSVADNKKSGDKYYHTVRSGESLGLIAQRNGVSLSKLRAWNNIYTNRIYPGQKLVVYGKGKEPKTTTRRTTTQTRTTSNNTIGQAIPSNKVYIVQEGDSLWLIARKFKGMTVEKLKQLNNLRSNSLKPGQRLKLG